MWMWMQVLESADVLVVASVVITGFDRELVEFNVHCEDRVHTRCFRPFHQLNGRSAKANTMRNNVLVIQKVIDGE
jgi:hypothetical protein